jgi:hypothetical protein
MSVACKAHATTTDTLALTKEKIDRNNKSKKITVKNRKVIKMQNKADMILETFVGVKLNTLSSVPIISVYKSPKDYPNKFVARLWDVNNKATNFIVVAETLEGIRKLIPENMLCIPPSEMDDSVIVEVYI